MDVHVRPEEQRIAFGQHGDHAPGIQMRCDLGRGVVKEFLDRYTVFNSRGRMLGRNGVQQRQIDRSGTEVVLCRVAGVTLVSGLRKVGDDVRPLQCTDRPDCQQVRVSGTYSDADQLPTHQWPTQGSALASALTAAATIALPPCRPRTVR